MKMAPPQGHFHCFSKGIKQQQKWLRHIALYFLLLLTESVPSTVRPLLAGRIFSVLAVHGCGWREDWHGGRGRVCDSFIIIIIVILLLTEHAPSARSLLFSRSNQINDGQQHGGR